MQYLGGKYRIRKKIAEYLYSVWDGKQKYIEPFVGGASVVCEVSSIPVRECSDANQWLILMWQAVQEGWEPPSVLSEQYYQDIKTLQPMHPITAFAMFGCSFGGKWGGGYAREETLKRNYAGNARNSILKKKDKIKGVVFTHRYYQDLDPHGALIYCDPPYANTTGYGAIGKFDHDVFWETMRKWSIDNTVVVSEYSAPEDFVCVLEVQTKTDLHCREDRSRKERLFRHKDNLKCHK